MVSRAFARRVFISSYSVNDRTSRIEEYESVRAGIIEQEMVEILFSSSLCVYFVAPNPFMDMQLHILLSLLRSFRFP